MLEEILFEPEEHEHAVEASQVAPGKELVLQELLERFTEADSYRKQFEEIATRCYKLYRVYKREAKNGRSNLHIPRTYEQIDTLRSRYVKSFTSQRPYAEFIPKAKGSPQEMILAEQKAKIAALLVDEQLESNNFKMKLYDFVTSMLVFPAAIMGVGWRYEENMVRRKHKQVIPLLDPFGFPLLDSFTGEPLTQEVIQIIEQPEVVYDDNELVNIDFFDFWVDPRGHDIDSCRFVFHREWLTREAIEQRVKVISEANGGTIYPVDWNSIGTAEGLEEGRWERQTEVGLSPITSDVIKEGKLRLYEVLHYWEDERYAMLINRKEVIYDGPNIYWRHSKKPFAVAVYEPLPNEFYGMSAVELIADLQEEVNTHRNQRVDNLSLILNRMWKVRRDADIDESELVSRPHGIIHVDSPDDVTEFAMNDVTSSSYMEEQVIKQDMENTLGVPAVVRGVDSARRETATEVVTKTSNAGVRFDVKIMLFESMFFKRVVKLMDLNNQQFIDTERAIRIVGPDGFEEWRMVTPEEIVGEFDYRPAGPAIDPAANKEVRRQQLMAAYQLFAGIPNPRIDIDRLAVEIIKSFDLPNGESFIKSEQQLAQEMMQQQMLMQQMQLAQAPPMQLPQQPEQSSNPVSSFGSLMGG